MGLPDIKFIISDREFSAAVSPAAPGAYRGCGRGTAAKKALDDACLNVVC